MSEGAQPEELTCEALVELVTDYVEGRLPPDDANRFDAHLEECEYCAAYVDQMRLTIRTLGRFEPESLTPATREELLAAFRGWQLRNGSHST